MKPGREAGNFVNHYTSTMPYDRRSIDQSTGAQRLATGLLIAISLLAGAAMIHFRPDRTYPADFVLGEDGNQLYRAEKILHGDLPYRDFALQYGFIPVYLSAAFAGLLGNTIRTNAIFHLVFSTACIVLFFKVLRRSADTVGALVATIVVLPILLDVGSLPGNPLNLEYLSIERICILTLLLIWQPPFERSWKRAIAIGVVLGIWQEVKFGGAFFCGAAIVAADLIWIVCKTSSTREISGWFKSLAIMFAAFMFLESFWLALLLATSPKQTAIDAAWPAYAAQSYIEINPAHRHPHFSTWEFFLQAQWIWLSCGLMSVVGLIAWCRSNFRTASAAPDLFLFIAPLFFLIAAPIYFGHEWLWYQYSWTLLLGASWCLPRMRVEPRVLLLLSWCMSWFFLLQTLGAGVDSSLTRLTLPDAEIVYANPFELRSIYLFSQIARESNSGKRFVLALMHWGGGGFYFFFERDYPLRNYMLDRIALREEDQRELMAKYGQIGAIVGGLEGTDIETRLRGVFGDSFSQRLLKDFRPISPDPDDLILVPKGNN